MTDAVIIGSDHAGYALKSEIIAHLHAQGCKTDDCGTYSEESADYPDIAHKVGGKVNTHPAGRGILICGSGNGVCITANKYPNIRAALCWAAEIVTLARQHNDANIICLPARFMDTKTALACISAFLNTEFEGGRHLRRVQKITPNTAT